MPQVSQKQGRGLLALVAALALAAAACSGSSATWAPAGSTNKPVSTDAAGSTAAVSTDAAATDSTVDVGGGIDGAAAKFAGITSYKFKMTIMGGTYAKTFAMLSGTKGTGNAAFIVSGTVVTTPAKAADIEMAGFHIIEIGGFNYMDMGTGTFYKTKMTSSMADGFSPATMFRSMVSSTSGYSKVGTEQKNGVNADHYSAGKATLAQLGKALGATTATDWASDVYVAVDGGFPVSTAIIGKDATGKVVFEFSFDVSNVNDSANKVTAPAVSQ